MGCIGKAQAFFLTIIFFCSLVTFQPDMVKASPKTLIVPDQYLTIQDAIDNASLGDIVSVKGGHYYEHLVIDKSISIIGQDLDKTIIDWNGTGAAITLNASNIIVTELTIQSPVAVFDTYEKRFTEYQGLYGIYLSNSSSECNVIKNKIINNQYAIYEVSSKDNSISQNIITENDSIGVCLHDSINTRISENLIQPLQEAITLYNSSSNNITTNTVVNGTNGISLIGSGGGYNGPSNFNTLNSNKIVGSSYCGIQITYSFNNTVSNNNILNVSHGIQLGSSSYNKVSSNLIANGSNWAIILLYSNQNTFSSNYITGNSAAVLGSNVSNNYFAENVITNNGEGLEIGSPPKGNIVFGNFIANNTGAGIAIGNPVDKSEPEYVTDANVIQANSVLNNGQIGLSLQNTNDNMIYGNNFTGNAIGIGIKNAASNLFYYNNFINNSNQTSMPSYNNRSYTYDSINDWDNGSVGNFWTNYNGVDVNGDGIGDTPYVFDQNNVDYYPLMQEIGIQVNLSYPIIEDLILTQVPTPNVPEFPLLATLTFLSASILATVVLVIRKRKAFLGKF